MSNIVATQHSPKLKLQPGQDPYKEENYNIFNQNDYAPDMMHSKAQKFIEKKLHYLMVELFQ